MIYISLAGELAECEVWSPGPVAGSVWAFNEEREMIVVHGRTTAIRFPHEIEYAWSDATAACMSQWKRLQNKYAPKLAPKDWRAALGVDKNMQPSA